MLAQGNFVPYYADEKALVFLREEAGEKLVVGVNLDTRSGGLTRAATWTP